MSDVLLLNFTYEKLRVITIKRAVCLLFAGKAEVVHARETLFASPSFEMKLPTVLRMLYYIAYRPQRVSLTKQNVLLRDDFRCAYCGIKGDKSNMTLDHVQPKSKGGPASWENLVTACMRCNGRKNNRTPEQARMPLRFKPYKPRYIPWVTVKRNTQPEEWGKYLGLWEVSIDERVEQRA